MRLLLILSLVTAASVASQVSYDNFKVYKMMIKNEEEKQFMQNLVKPLDASTNYWSGLSLSLATSVMVAPKDLDYFLKQMNRSGIQYELFIDNVQDLIDNQNTCKNKGEDFNWTCYHTLDKIYNWLDNLSRKYPESVQVITGGYTYEGREIKGVKISYKQNNPGIFIESGIHSYEWIAPATATYLINEFLTSEEPSVRKLAESYDWYIFPSVNPDGYVYTFTGDRMWSKNRSKGNSSCMGVNLNRNWDYKYKNDSNPCDPKYGGVKSSSEVEIITLSRYIRSLKDKLFSYISFHSFTQLLMVPYFYTLEHLDNYNETIIVANKAVDALSRRYGTKYTVGTGAKVMYGASGVSVDWVKANLKLPMVFAYELRDTGDFGMLLPTDQIIPTGQEILDSLVAMFEEARRLGYPKSNGQDSA